MAGKAGILIILAAVYRDIRWAGDKVANDIMTEKEIGRKDQDSDEK
jgi:hypothetical protein